MAARGMILHGVGASFVLLPLAGAGFAQEDGQLAFNNHCRTCHTTDEGDHRTGPSLHNVIGREAGSLPDFASSDAMRNSSVVWDEATLDRFIENPEAVVRGNTMQPFTGIPDADVRAAIVGYLQAESDR
jgi:cytochrome c